MLRDFFSPARLTQARHLARLTKVEVARAVGVSAASIGQYEAGVVTPGQSVIAQLARVLDVPEGFFVAGRPLASVDSGGVYFRSLRSTPARERDFCVALAQQVWELLVEVESLVELPALHLPETGSLQSRSPIAAAAAVRDAWMLGYGPVKHLVRTAESHGLVFAMPVGRGRIDERTDAYTAIDLPRPVSVLSPRDAGDVMRHRFSVAHEIGHLVMHCGVPAGSAAQEREADQFAAELLAPAAVFSSLLPTRVDLAALADVSAEWGLSIKALIYRARELRRVSDDAARRGYVRLAEARVSGALAPRPINQVPGEQPRLLLDAVRLATAVVGELELASRLGLSPARLRDLVGEDSRPRLRVVP